MTFMPFSFLALPALRVFMLCSNGASKVLLLVSELAASISLAASCRANAGVGRTKQWDEPRVLVVPVQLVHERQRMAATSSTLSSSTRRRQGPSGSAHEHVLVEASR